MRFRVKALDGSGQVVCLHLEAADARGAQRAAHARGLAPLAVHADGWRAVLALGRRQSFEVELFIEELLALLDAGLSLVEAIGTLAEQAAATADGSPLDELRRLLAEGRRFSQAAERLPHCFSPLFVVTVRAAEDSGQLRQALGRFLAYRKAVEQVRRRVVAASIYPTLLLGVGALVGLFMLLYVVPRFGSIYEGIGGELPWLTRRLIDWGQLVSQHTGSLLLALLAGGATIALLTRQAIRNGRLGRAIAALPLLGQRLRRYELARFYRTLAMLLDSGLALPKAIDLAAPLGSPALQQALAHAATRIREGGAISAAFVAAGVATPLSTRLLGVGEQSGQLAEMCGRIASFHEDELNRGLERLMAVFEPVLMLFIGAIIGLLLLLLYLPIFELAENLR